MSNLAIYKFNLYCGRMGDLDGVFIGDIKDVESLYGRTIHFGEVLGKYSDINAEMKESNFKLVTQDESVINIFLKHDLETGINPLCYANEDEEDNYDGEDSDDWK